MAGSAGGWLLGGSGAGALVEGAPGLAVDAAALVLTSACTVVLAG